MVWHSFKLAYRNIIKNRKSYILNISGLIIALTVGFITLFYVEFEHRIEKRRFNAEHVFLVKEKYNTLGWEQDNIPIGLSNYLRNEIPGIQQVVTYIENSDFPIQVSNDKIFHEKAFHFVDSNYMNCINKTTLAGNCMLQGHNDVLLTKETALKYFATTHCIGKQISVFGDNDMMEKFVVSGVFSYPAPNNSRPEHCLVARIDALHSLKKDFNYGNKDTKTEAYIILEQNADKSNILEQIKQYYINHINKEYFTKKTVALLSFKQNYFRWVKDKLKTAILISIIILLVALVNFIIHNNAQYWKRCRAIGLNKILGSKPFQIFKQSFVESFIIHCLSLALAFLFASVLLPYVKIYLNEAMSIKYLPLSKLFLFGLGIVFFISLLACFSSLLLLLHQPVRLVFQRLNKGTKGKLVNSSLITIQISITAFLMIMFFTTSSQLRYVQNINWGFHAEEVLKIFLRDGISADRFNDFKSRIGSISGVISYSGCWHVPPENSRFFIGIEEANGEITMIDRNTVDYPYLKTIGIKLKSGRDFDREADIPGKNIIVNQEFLDYKNIINPYDTLIELNNNFKKVVGVTEKYHMRGMHEKIDPQIIELSPNESRHIIIKISPHNVLSTLNEIEHHFHEVYPYKSFEMGFVEDDIQNLYQTQKRFNTLVSAYTLIAMLITVMGLFGFVMSEMNKRVKEVGIRKVNGAKITELFHLLNKEFLIFSLSGFLISSPIAWYFTKKWFENFAYHTEINWLLFLLSAAIIFLIVFITVSLQTMQVANRNPVEALRYE